MTREEYNLNPNICLNCGKEILCPEGKRPSEIKKKKFCNQSCSASYNNKNRDKRKYFCEKCGELIREGYAKYHRRKYCDKCSPNYKDWSKITYGEVKDLRKYQPNSRIRELARKIYFENGGSKSCQRCGYDKHIEVCHIHPISEFSDDTPISVINDLSNLIGLCPNCHWELDYGDLTIDEIICAK